MNSELLMSTMREMNKRFARIENDSDPVYVLASKLKQAKLTPGSLTTKQTQDYIEKTLSWVEIERLVYILDKIKGR